MNTNPPQPLPNYPDIHFHYGVMGSAKSLHLLILRHNLLNQGQRVLVVKSALDLRDPSHVRSRIPGMECKVDLILDQTKNYPGSVINFFHYILIDEVQFMTTHQMEQIISIARLPNSLVKEIHCYGLLTDFRTNLFPATKYLVENADNLHQVNKHCANCTRWAQFNMKVVQAYVNSYKVTKGDSVDCNASYLSVCARCFHQYPEMA